MPAKLNVGLSRKIGEANYSSRGANVNLEVELDASVVNEPQRLRDRIRKLFSLVRVAVQEELEACGPSNGSSSYNGAHQSHDNGQGASSDRPATASQVRAIHAIANRQRVDLPRLLQNRFGCQQPDDLSLRDASRLIDDLKGEDGGRQ